MAASAIALGADVIANLPKIIGVIRTVQGLFGKGRGADKLAAAAAALPNQGVVVDNPSGLIDAVIAIMKAIGMPKDPTDLPAVPAGGCHVRHELRAHRRQPEAGYELSLSSCAAKKLKGPSI